jgi:membrane protein required for colicin V production
MDISIIDLIMGLVLVVGAINGFRKGVILQLGVVAGVVVGVWLAFRVGSSVSAWIGVEMSPLVAYILVFVAAIAAMWLLTHLLSKILSTIGLGIINRLCGAVVSLALSSMILSLAFGFFVKCNNALQIVEPEVLEASKVAPWVDAVADVVFPYLEQAKEGVMESMDQINPEAEEDVMESMDEINPEAEEMVEELQQQQI